MERDIHIVAVDFDGTLDHGDYPDKFVPDLIGIQLMRRFQQHGGKIILWTCRSGKALEAAVEMCKAYGLEFDAVNENLKSQVDSWLASGFAEPGPQSPKVSADLYIDDRGNTGINWSDIEKMLSGLEKIA
jgi:hypothetical protein